MRKSLTKTEVPVAESMCFVQQYVKPYFRSQFRQIKEEKERAFAKAIVRFHFSHKKENTWLKKFACENAYLYQ
jgi:hypothetical protein